jgi:hypothetical protein
MDQFHGKSRRQWGGRKGAVFVLWVDLPAQKGKRMLSSMPKHHAIEVYRGRGYNVSRYILNLGTLTM